MTGKAKIDKDKDRDDGDKKYSLDDVGHDLKLIATTVNALRNRSEAMEKRIEAVESLAGNAIADESGSESFDSADKRKSLSVLADRVFRPDDTDIIKAGMTEIPNRMVMPIVIERTMNEYIKIITAEPNTDVLLSDIFMQQYAIVMRALRRQLIQEAMGFSQIEMEKQIDEEQRGLEAQAEG